MTLRGRTKLTARLYRHELHPLLAGILVVHVTLDTRTILQALITNTAWNTDFNKFAQGRVTQPMHRSKCLDTQLLKRCFTTKLARQRLEQPCHKQHRGFSTLQHMHLSLSLLKHVPQPSDNLRFCCSETSSFRLRHPGLWAVPEGLTEFFGCCSHGEAIQKAPVTRWCVKVDKQQRFPGSQCGVAVHGVLFVDLLACTCGNKNSRGPHWAEFVDMECAR